MKLQETAKVSRKKQESKNAHVWLRKIRYDIHINSYTVIFDVHLPFDKLTVSVTNTYAKFSLNTLIYNKHESANISSICRK